MIRGFNRSITLPMSPRLKVLDAYHVRSVSFPTRSHPLSSNLEEHIRAVRSWAASPDGSLEWIEAGLSRIELLHSALNDFLKVSETKMVLRRITASTEHLLESLLYLVDSYGLLVSSMETLKQQQFEVESAFRRHDSVQLTSSLKSQRRTEKELSRLVSSLRAVTKCPLPALESDNATEAEIVGILKEAICATSAASVSVFNRVAAVSTAASNAAALSASSTLALPLFKKKLSREETEVVASEKFEELLDCVRIVESGSERVFRSVVNSRVALLNIQSESF